MSLSGKVRAAVANEHAISDHIARIYEQILSPCL
jgi:hypothetical protein